MASMEEALCAYFMARTDITALIGTGSSGRLYADVLPQSYTVAAGPAATYEIVSSTEESLLAPDRSGFVQSRVQVTSFADSRASAMATARAFKNSGIATLKGISGGVDFRGVLIESGIRAFVETPTDGSSEWRYLAEFDLLISYHEGT